MPALLYVASHTTSGAARLVAQMPRLHARLAATPGVVAGRVFATASFFAPTSGFPTLRRYAMLCGFEDDQALADFEDSAAAAAFVDGARESWRLTLEPVRVMNGSWRGWRPDTEDVEPLDMDEPMAALTYGIVRPRYAAKFAVTNRRVIAKSMNQEGQIMRLALFDRPLSVCTFSLWRSKGDAVRFAYGSGTLHKAAIRPWLDVPWGRDNFFARFRVRESVGTCGGFDPLARAEKALVTPPWQLT